MVVLVEVKKLQSKFLTYPASICQMVENNTEVKGLQESYCDCVIFYLDKHDQIMIYIYNPIYHRLIQTRCFYLFICSCMCVYVYMRVYVYMCGCMNVCEVCLKL